MRFKGNNKKASKEEAKEKKDENSYESSSEEEDEEEEQDCKALTRLMNRVGKSKTCSSCNIEIPLNALRCYSCHVDQPPDLLNVVEPITVTKSVKNYKIYQITIQDEDAEIPPFHRYIFKLKERGLIQSLAGYVPGVVMKPSKRKFSKKYTSTVRALDIIIALPKLRAALPLLPALVQNFVNDEIEPMRKQMVAEIDSCLKYKKITMDALWYIFEPGTAIYGTEENGLKLGSLVKQSSYNAGFMGCSFAITGSIIKTDGEKFFYSDHIFNIDGFEGMKPIDSLSVRVLDRYSFEELSKRGEKYCELGLGHHFVQFRGMMIRSVGTFTVKTRMKSRVMVDTKTYNRYHLSVNKYRHLGVSSHNDLNVSTTLSKDEYWMTYPCLPGFSFSMKLWGEYAISDLSTIQFDTSAFTHLVLPEKKKVLIHALVEDYRKGVALSQKIEQIQSEKKKQRYKKSKKKRMEEEKAGINDDSIVEPARHDEHGNNRLFTDIITGKGGGCIFLLHGSPGVGKTLTAEAVCEYLHIPLYMITVGELGTTPNTLEKKLQDILELSAAWGCGILLDEADIFLEKRSKKDILRNAMVGIFLRLLEYHNGVLFLTTNRLSCLDEAFSSRISVALHYDDLDEDARFKIWTTFLAATNNRPDVIAAIDVKQLAAFELNGRQIRSCVRLSTARARNDKTVLSMNHLLTTIRLSLDFKTQFSNEKTVKRSRKQSRFQQTIQVKIPELADPNVTLTGEL